MTVQGRGPAPPDPMRSAIMRAVRRQGTTPELRVRRALAVLGLRFRANVGDLPGSPDLANKARKTAIFVHGCFWHRHPRCSRATTPKANAQFWRTKFDANIARDRRKARALRKLGYRVIVLWECQTTDPNRLLRRLYRTFGLTGGRSDGRE